MNLPQSLRGVVVDVEERSLSKNPLMSDDADWSIKHRSVKCGGEPVSAKEKTFQHRESVNVEFRLYFPVIDLDETDRIVGRGGMLKDGVQYGIVGISPWGKFLLVSIQRWE